MNKKLFSIVLCLVLTLCAFTACTPSQQVQPQNDQTAETTDNSAGNETSETVTPEEETPYLGSNGSISWHDITINVPGAVGKEVADDQLNVAVDGCMINIFYLEDANEMKDADKSLRNYIESFNGTTIETSETAMNGTKVGVATYEKDGNKGKVYLFSLKNRHAYSFCSTFKKGASPENEESIKVLDDVVKNIVWENK